MKDEILAKVTFQIQGKPKKHVEETLKKYLEKVGKEEEIEIKSTHIEKAEKQGELWSSFAEVDVLVNNLEKFTWLCVNFMPASIEILEPAEFQFKNNELQNWLNDVLSRLHQVDSIAKQTNNLNKILDKNVNTIIKNFIIILLKGKINIPRKLAKLIGIPLDVTNKFLELLVKEKIIKKKKGEFELVKKQG